MFLDEYFIVWKRLADETCIVIDHWANILYIQLKNSQAMSFYYKHYWQHKPAAFHLK